MYQSQNSLLLDLKELWKPGGNAWSCVFFPFPKSENVIWERFCFLVAAVVVFPF